nr:MAG TPA: hypothetical protein [Caudoviricetes sp.]
MENRRMTHEGDPPYIVNCEKWGYEREPEEPQREYYEEKEKEEWQLENLLKWPWERKKSGC